MNINLYIYFFSALFNLTSNEHETFFSTLITLLSTLNGNVNSTFAYQYYTNIEKAKTVINNQTN